ncbi:hypothetical protein [Truepera radiovictrix]|uniref:hypothetical protein n=1 Tax=Truepera radiovictrix TaxID=332249 RepID=UPI000307B8EA|nr:hypothetical protein [Truepera radiovictrix]WMT56554.1 hypothetical protein RCV51_11135 [Truepera radiovictrix]
MVRIARACGGSQGSRAPRGVSPEALFELGTRHAEAEAALLAAMAAWEETAERLSIKV